MLPVLPISHLFAETHEFAAVPDVGWPDIFNSGVLVVSPGEDKFNELMELQKTKALIINSERPVFCKSRQAFRQLSSLSIFVLPTKRLSGLTAKSVPSGP